MNLRCLLYTLCFQESHPGCIYPSGSSCLTTWSFQIYSTRDLNVCYEASSPGLIRISLAFEDDVALGRWNTSSFRWCSYKSLVSRLTWGLRVPGKSSLPAPIPCLLSYSFWPLMLSPSLHPALGARKIGSNPRSDICWLHDIRHVIMHLRNW